MAESYLYGQACGQDGVPLQEQTLEIAERDQFIAKYGHDYGRGWDTRDIGDLMGIECRLWAGILF